MKKNFKGGFTLIELLVVIAIIGILASVVLASLNTARNKGADAKIKAELANARAQAELYYDSQTTPSYDGVCAAAATANGINGILTSAASTAGISSPAIDGNSATSSTVANCRDVGPNATGGTGWAMEIPLKTSGFYCVDSKMKSQTNGSAGLSNSATDIDC